MDTSQPLAPGSLDPDFATNGIFTFTTDPYGMLSINRLALSSDGSITVALRHLVREHEKNFYCLARLLNDGTPDPAFGRHGLVQGQFKEDAESWGASVAIRDEKSILLSGHYLPQGTDAVPRKVALVQYTTEGRIDSGFGEKGFVYLDFPPPKSTTESQHTPAGGPPDMPIEFFGFKVTPLPDGKIMFSGVLEVQTKVGAPWTRFSVLGRLKSDGSLDESFGERGWVYPKPPLNIADQHLIQADGKILLTGQMENVPGGRGYVARYLPDGTLDNGFGSSGYVLFEGLDGGHVTAMALHGAEEKLLIGANKKVNGDWSGVLRSYTRQGEPDVEFNGGQPLDVKLGASSFKLILKDMVIDDDGVVLLGEMGNIALVRYFLDGSPDLGYGNRSGWQEVSGTETYALARQPDGKLVATAMAVSGEKIVARFLSN
ncbi:hypothetical protein EGJ27_05235 [Pseudomonas sp. v388]|uniref:hypothetical protein n=1 Tax=Pseudomonas sp. v388 TaxID=2479849 RepID=UPI000F772FAA|nr:hypothetical protein [Pseudomonas sp. v388]RRV09176.1 hypothetical protein EGJ27_05235 [Pseudomonas sp. v388]